MVFRVKENGWARGALLGLGSGTLLEMILRDVPGVHITGVDHFIRPSRKMKALNIASKYAPYATIHICTISQAAPLIPDEGLDFVFLDAGHKYGCVRADIRSWWPKVRFGGWFGGHDYTPRHPGVVRAVDERFNRQVSIEADTTWWKIKT